MKYIEKGNEPQSFTDWKSNGNLIYNDLINPQKSELKTALLIEQGYICCYCESKISSDTSHIEHFKPKDKDKFPELQLNYDNLLCSCQKQLSKGEPRHCGNSKGNEIILMTPLMEDCESKFTYTEDGQINHTDEDSKQTIRDLQLDIDKLNDLRNKAIELFIIDSETYEEIPYEEAKIFAKQYLQKDDGRYNEFYTTIKYLFGS